MVINTGMEGAAFLGLKEETGAVGGGGREEKRAGLYQQQGTSLLYFSMFSQGRTGCTTYWMAGEP